MIQHIIFGNFGSHKWIMWNQGIRFMGLHHCTHHYTHIINTHTYTYIIYEIYYVVYSFCTSAFGRQHSSSQFQFHALLLAPAKTFSCLLICLSHFLPIQPRVGKRCSEAHHKPAGLGFFSPRVWKHIQETKRPPKIIFHTWANQDSRLWRRGLRHQGRRFAHSTNSMRSLHRWSSFEPTVMVKQLLHLHSRLVFCWGSLSGSPAKASDEWQFPTHPSKEKQRVLQDMICCWMINPSGIVDHIWKPCKTWTIWLSWPERQICNFIFILHS